MMPVLYQPSYQSDVLPTNRPGKGSSGGGGGAAPVCAPSRPANVPGNDFDYTPVKPSERRKV